MTALDSYLRSVRRPEHPELVALRERTAALPFVAMMQGSPSIADLLQFLIGLTGARQVLEVGAFTGCSTLAMATALPPDGKIVAIDISDKWPGIGREYWERSGCADRIDLRIGSASAVLDQMIDEGRVGTFDLAFVDADKDAYESYFERCLVLLRDGGVMVFDNVLFGGAVAGGDEQRPHDEPTGPQFLRELNDRYVEGLRRFNQRVTHDARVDVAMLPMTDGVSIVRKRPAMAAGDQRRS